MSTVITLLVGLGILAIAWIYKAWNTSESRRERFLGTDAPEVFERLKLEQDVHFEPHKASSTGEINGRSYSLTMRSPAHTESPYAHHLDLEVEMSGLLPDTVRFERVHQKEAEPADEGAHRVALHMPMSTFEVDLEALCAFLFDEQGQRLASCVTQTGIDLEEITCHERGLDLTLSLDTRHGARLGFGDDARRRTFITSVMEELLDVIGALQSDATKSNLELYGFAIGQVKATDPGWSRLRDFLFVQHVKDPVSRSAWSLIMKQARPDHMSALLDFDASRFCKLLQPFEIQDRLIAALSYDRKERDEEVITALLPWLEPKMLCVSELPLSFRMRVMRLWLEHNVFGPEELAPAIALMKEQMSRQEQSRLVEFVNESGLRGGLSQSGESLQGALSVDDDAT